MALETLLASLKYGVSEVAGVQACKTKVFVCNPEKFTGVAEVSGSAVGTATETHETPPASIEVSVKPLPERACTCETPATPKTIKGETSALIDPEAWEERAAIAEFDGGFSRDEAEQLAWREDDRRRCEQCKNLTGRHCQAAKRGEIVASRNYEPIPDMLKRCEGYAPGTQDLDRRHGRERWTWLIQKGEQME